MKKLVLVLSALLVVALVGCGDTYVDTYPAPPTGYVYSADGYLIPINPGIGFVYVSGGQFRYQNRLVYVDRPGHIVTTAPVHVNINSNSKRSGGFNTSVPASGRTNQWAATPSDGSSKQSGGFNRSTPSTYSRPSAPVSRPYSAPVSRPTYSAPRSSGGFRR